MFRVIQLFVFAFGRIVHRTIRIRPNSLKPLFGTSLLTLILNCSAKPIKLLSSLTAGWQEGTWPVNMKFNTSKSMVLRIDKAGKKVCDNIRLYGALICNLYQL